MARSNSASKKRRGESKSLVESFAPPPQERRIDRRTVRVQGRGGRKDDSYNVRFPHIVLEWNLIDDQYWVPHRVAPRSLNYQELLLQMPDIINERIALFVECHYQHDKITTYQVLYPTSARTLYQDDQIAIRPTGGMPAIGRIKKISDVVEASAGNLQAEFIGWIEFTPQVQAQIDQRRLQARQKALVESLRKRQESVDLAEQFRALAKIDPVAAAELAELEIVQRDLIDKTTLVQSQSVQIEHKSTDIEATASKAKKPTTRR